MFTQVRTHFTLNTPRLIVHTCSEDCLGFTKYIFVLSWKIFNFFGGVRNPRFTSRERPYKQGEKFRLWSRQTDSFLCRQEKFSCIVWTPIWYVTLHFRDPRGAASLRYRNRVEISVLICEQKPYPLWFLCWRKSNPVLCKHSLRLSDGRQNTPRIWKVDQLYQMAGVTKHATRIVFFF